MHYLINIAYTHSAGYKIIYDTKSMGNNQDVKYYRNN